MWKQCKMDFTLTILGGLIIILRKKSRSWLFTKISPQEECLSKEIEIVTNT